MERRQFLKAFAGLAVCPLCAGGRARAEAGHDWGYSGPHGPQHWGGVCSTGDRQSPIDIRSVSPSPLPNIDIGWAEQASTITNNGHTIEVACGGTMSRADRQYQLVQFHFHHPSEHHVNGRRFPMEVHFVHTGQGGRSVIGALMTGGAANATFSRIAAAMPRQHGSVAAPPDVDPRKLLPASLRYYVYAGSLTTPDCAQDVTWIVLAQPVAVSSADIAAFANVYPMNARPLQPLKKRGVQVSA